MPKSLQGFIQEVSDEVLTVDREIRPDLFEASAVLAYLEKRSEWPLVHFTNPLGINGVDTAPGKVTLASNVFADRKRLARALGMPRSQYRMELALEMARREREAIAPEIIKAKDAPVKEVSQVKEYGEGRIDKLPMMRINEMDPAPYFDMANVMRGPESQEDDLNEGNPFYNSAFLRTQYKGPDKLGIHMSPRHNHRIVAESWANDEPTPVAIVLGHHPAYYLGSLTLAAYGTDEYGVMGAVMDEPLRLVPSETWGDDFMVPADAEIVLEGEIPPHELEAEAPFGEYPGYYGPMRMRPVINVTNITRRENAVLQTVFAGYRDHWLAGTLSKEAGMYNALKHYGRIPYLTACHQPPSGCGRFRAYVSIAKQSEGEGKMAGLAAIAQTDQILKEVVVVDDDIDVFNEAQVQWAISTRCRFDQDIDIIPGAKNNTLDPTIAPGYDVKGPKMIIDATQPLEYAYAARVNVPDDIKAVVEDNPAEWINESDLQSYRSLGGDGELGDFKTTIVKKGGK